jgi:hypothetical protein
LVGGALGDHGKKEDMLSLPDTSHLPQEGILPDAQPTDSGEPEECAAALDRARADLPVIAEQWAQVAVG